MRSFVAAALVVALAGCADAPPSVDEPTIDPPQARPDVPMGHGLTLNATLDHRNGLHVVSTEVHNQGPSSFRVDESCETNFFHNIRLIGDRNLVDAQLERECADVPSLQIRPGETLELEASWNETIWNARATRWEPAGLGNYTWTVGFRFHTMDDRRGNLTSSLDFEIQDLTGQAAMVDKESLPGLNMTGAVVSQAGLHVMTGQATNDDGETYQLLYTCTPPWRSALHDAEGKTVMTRVPIHEGCSLSWETWSPSDLSADRFVWDGMRWDDETREMVPAEPGVYTWSLVFALWEEKDHDLPPKTLRLDFEIVVD